jgi:hypothetical protein
MSAKADDPGAKVRSLPNSRPAGAGRERGNGADSPFLLSPLRVRASPSRGRQASSFRPPRAQGRTNTSQASIVPLGAAFVRAEIRARTLIWRDIFFPSAHLPPPPCPPLRPAPLSAPQHTPSRRRQQRGQAHPRSRCWRRALASAGATRSTRASSRPSSCTAARGARCKVRERERERESESAAKDRLRRGRATSAPH